ncbi:hypothetical protein ACIQZG_20985 [Lysinibacillus sp. NPDC096418]|uniref:hypothetical protein n=1 Tax=Lysinibacillus sp. NPDC096418 TaxID=3364138 RepID=UPI00382F5FF5
MKKICHLGILILISFLLSACSSDRPMDSTTESTVLNIPLKIDNDAEIVFFNNENLYYFTDETNDEKPDLAKKILHEYSFADQKSNILSSYNDVSIYSGSKVLNGNNLYLSLTQNNNNILAEINLKNKSSKIIKKWITNPSLAYVYTLKNNVILFGPNSLDESSIEYSIDAFNPVNGKEENVVKKEIKDQKGEILPSLDVDGDYIYAFSITANDDEHEYNIIKYDLTGKQVSIYPFDLKAFLKPSKTLVDQDDAIFKIYKEKEYFILNTLNGRVFIFKLINNKLQPVEIPDAFYKENPSGFRFIEYYEGESDFAYFYNTFENNNVITVFNYLSEEITTLKFPKENSIYNYFRNATGDLIVNKRTEQGLNKFNYYDFETLLKNYEVVH